MPIFPQLIVVLPQRKSHMLWLTFWPQDLVLFGWLLIIAAFSLFLVTVLLGRVWCGYSCPQTLWTAIFLWAEQITEGARNARIKLDAAPLGFSKIWRKGVKHVLWLGSAGLTGITFVAYFYGTRALWVMLPTSSYLS